MHTAAFWDVPVAMWCCGACGHGGDADVAVERWRRLVNCPLNTNKHGE